VAQLITIYTTPERHNAQPYTQTDDVMMPTVDHAV